MKIKRLLVEDFGKFHQSEFAFGPEINVLTGENESGKTTLRHFLLAMWYGMERERGLKARKDDYTRYKPWYFGRFQGSVELEVEGNRYHIRRNFLTKEAEGFCVETGKSLPEVERFFEEHGRVPETVYRNTFWNGNECRTETVLAENLRNHMANFAYTGGMNLDLSAAGEKLKRQRREWEKQLPDKELAVCMEQMLRRAEQEQKLERQWELLRQAEESYSREEKELEKAQEQAEQLRERVIQATLRQERMQKGEWLVVLFAVLALLLAGILQWLLPENGMSFLRTVCITGSVISAVGFLVGAVLVVSNKNHGKKECEEALDGLQRNIFVLYENTKTMLPGIEKIRLEMEQAEEQLQECEQVEVRYQGLLEKKKRIERELEAIALAQKTIEALSAAMYEEYGERFYGKMSEYVAEFTDGAYKKLTADEDLNLYAVTRDRRVDIAEVSYGTAQQFYMALRFAVADVFDPDKQNPIVLDDSFAAFDEQRLESALLALAKSGRQILLFSSTGREEVMLKRMGVTYEKVYEKTGSGRLERD